jgi:hypothetical protein
VSDVTGPISSLPGARHTVPKGQKCDQHRRRVAVVRIQGETDSFGCELIDMCQKCLDRHIAWKNSPAAIERRKGTCEWCKNSADDLRDARDFEEGLSGRVYRVCGACIKRQNEELKAEAEEFEDCGDDDWSDDDE